MQAELEELENTIQWNNWTKRQVFCIKTAGGVLWWRSHLSQFPCAALWCMNGMKVWLLWNGCRSSLTWRGPGSRSFGCWHATSFPWISGFIRAWDCWWCLLYHTQLTSSYVRNHCLTIWSNPKQVGKLDYFRIITTIEFVISKKHMIKTHPWPLTRFFCSNDDLAFLELLWGATSLSLSSVGVMRRGSGCLRTLCFCGVIAPILDSTCPFDFFCAVLIWCWRQEIT